MAKQEVKEVGWMLKWALILGFMGAIIFDYLYSKITCIGKSPDLIITYSF